jgi:hypothetical protein
MRSQPSESARDPDWPATATPNRSPQTPPRRDAPGTAGSRSRSHTGPDRSQPGMQSAADAPSQGRAKVRPRLRRRVNATPARAVGEQVNRSAVADRARCPSRRHRCLRRPRRPRPGRAPPERTAAPAAADAVLAAGAKQAIAGPCHRTTVEHSRPDRIIAAGHPRVPAVRRRSGCRGLGGARHDDASVAEPAPQHHRAQPIRGGRCPRECPTSAARSTPGERPVKRDRRRVEEMGAAGFEPATSRV